MDAFEDERIGHLRKGLFLEAPDHDAAQQLVFDDELVIQRGGDVERHQHQQQRDEGLVEFLGRHLVEVGDQARIAALDRIDHAGSGCGDEAAERDRDDRHIHQQMGGGSDLV